MGIAYTTARRRVLFNLNQFLAQLTELYQISWSSDVCVCEWVCVCLGVNQGGTIGNHCTQRLVTLHAQTY